MRLLFLIYCALILSTACRAQAENKIRNTLHFGINMDIVGSFYPEMSYSRNDVVEAKFFGTSIRYSQFIPIDEDYLKGTLIGCGLGLNLSKIRRQTWLHLSNTNKGIFGTDFLVQHRIQKRERLMSKVGSRSGIITSVKFGRLRSDYIYTNSFYGYYYPGVSFQKEIANEIETYAEFNFGYQLIIGEYIKLELLPIHIRSGGPYLNDNRNVRKKPLLLRDDLRPKFALYFNYTL